MSLFTTIPVASQRVHVFLTPASFPLGWGVKGGILNLFVSGSALEKWPHTRLAQMTSFPCLFPPPACCALREGYLPPSLSRKLRSVTCSILDHSTQLCPRGPSQHALGRLYSRNMDRVSLVKPGCPPVPSQAF